MHYSMSINGKVEEGTMEIDTANNVERFSTGSGSDEAVEVHDFQIVSSAQEKEGKTRPAVDIYKQFGTAGKLIIVPTLRNNPPLGQSVSPHIVFADFIKI